MQTATNRYKATKLVLRNGDWEAMKPTFHNCATEDPIVEYYASNDDREYGTHWLLEVEVVKE
jgi:hypothetical protein